MKRVLYSTTIIILFFISLDVTLFSNLMFVNAEDLNNTMIVQANIIGFNISGTIDGVAIEVSPNYIDLGNITKDDPVSKEKRVDIINVGTVNVSVTPMLKNENDEILDYLFFRTRTKSSNQSLNIFYRIGEYTLFLPFKGANRDEYCYMSLDLTNFKGEIEESPFSYESEITFLAMAK